MVKRITTGIVLPFRHGNRKRSLLLAGYLLVGLLPGMMVLTHAQAPAPKPVTGLIYYALENRVSGQVDQRGIAGSAGVAFDRLILAPNTLYRIWLLEAATLRVAELDITTPTTGQRLSLPVFVFHEPSAHDTDLDGLHDLGEFILGTDARDADTDDDGILDGAEVIQGTDPLDNTPARTGIIGTSDTPGTAIDVAAFNDVVVVADSLFGVLVFNVFNGMDPLIIAQVDTPGSAQAVSLAGNLVAVADGFAGLAVIDISDPPAAGIIQQVFFNSGVRAVASDGLVGFLGLGSGVVAAVDLVSGFVLDQLILSGNPIEDLIVSGDLLHVIVEGTYYVVSFSAGELSVVGSIASPGGVNTANGRMRLFVGGGIAYPVHRQGYNTIDVSDPTQPQIITSQNTPQFGWKQIVLNGSGLGIAAVSPNQAFDGPHHVSLYDVTDPLDNNDFVTEFETPGIARAVALYNGIAYVADHQNGLQVVNYLAFDNQEIPPTVSLETNAAANQAEEGQRVRISALVGDDVQVRNVEFLVDGVRVATDGNFPFEIRVSVPLLEDRSSFTIRARASDTGGNFSFTDELTIEVLQDFTAPQLVAFQPGNSAILPSLAAISAIFSEPIDTFTLDHSSFNLLSAGPDRILGNGDDFENTDGTFTYREEFNTEVLEFASSLAAGLYQVTIGTQIADPAGNALAGSEQWTFTVFGETDTDTDGIPDDVEALLGLDPGESDSDGNGTPDGAEDFDSDGLSNAGEIILGNDPANPDTDDNGVLDGDENPDNDGLTNSEEIAAGTNPTLADSDGDQYSDDAELLVGTDPLDVNSVPIASGTGGAVPVSLLDLSIQGGILPPGTHLAQPPVTIDFEPGP